MPRPRRDIDHEGRTRCPRCKEYKYDYQYYWTVRNGVRTRNGYCKECDKKYRYGRKTGWDSSWEVKKKWERVDNEFDDITEVLAWLRNGDYADVAELYEKGIGCIESSDSTQGELQDGRRFLLSGSVTHDPLASLIDTSTTTKNGPADS